MSEYEGATAKYPHELSIGDRIAPHGDALHEYESIIRITMDDQQCHYCVYTDKMPDYPVVLSRHDLVRVATISPTAQDAPRQPLEERDAEIERLKAIVDKVEYQHAGVRGLIVGALAGGHIDGNDGAAYSKAVIAGIADMLDIEIPADIKTANGLY